MTHAISKSGFVPPENSTTRMNSALFDVSVKPQEVDGDAPAASMQDSKPTEPASSQQSSVRRVDLHRLNTEFGLLKLKLWPTGL